MRKVCLILECSFLVSAEVICTLREKSQLKIIYYLIKKNIFISGQGLKGTLVPWTCHSSDNKGMILNVVT